MIVVLLLHVQLEGGEEGGGEGAEVLAAAAATLAAAEHAAQRAAGLVHQAAAANCRFSQLVHRVLGTS